MLRVFHTAGLLILIFSFQSQSEVISPFERVAAEIGDDVILRCYLGPVSNVSNMTVEWTRADLDPRFIHVWPERPELQNPTYKGRTSLFTDKLKDGYIWLKISNVKTSDKGMYTCFSPELDEKSTVQLIVYDKVFPRYADSRPTVIGSGTIGAIGYWLICSIPFCLILAVAFIVWKVTQGKFNKKEKSMEDGSDQNRKEKVIYSKRDNSEFKVTVERGEREILLTGREEKEETQDEHMTKTEPKGDMERPEGERIIPSIIIEKASESTTDQETDDENEMTGRRVKAEGGEDEEEKMMESVKYYLGVQVLPLKDKEKLMSGKSSSIELGIYFNLDQKGEREQEEQFVEEREKESDVDIKQLNIRKRGQRKRRPKLITHVQGFHHR